MKNSGFAKIGLALVAVVTITQQSRAQLTVDDFSSGAYQKTLKSGSDNNFQFGGMVGGSRATTFVACSPASKCAVVNPFGQPSSFQIRPKTKTTPNVLIFNSGYKSEAFLAVGYGFSSPMSLDLSGSYDRIRVTFDGVDGAVNFNLTVWSNAGSVYSQLGCNFTDPSLQTAFTVDFPFAKFVPGGGSKGADFSGITNMQFLFDGAQGASAGEDWAVTSLQAIRIGAPAGDITCAGGLEADIKTKGVLLGFYRDAGGLVVSFMGTP
jgi:hypothetical protein